MYHSEYQLLVDQYQGQLAFANPGVERQGSVENGLNKLVQVAGDKCAYVAIHDSARPLVTIQEVCDVVKDAKQYGAAVLGVPWYVLFINNPLMYFVAFGSLLFAILLLIIAKLQSRRAKMENLYFGQYLGRDCGRYTHRR